MIKWFDVRAPTEFAREQASFILRELTGISGKRDALFARKAQQVLTTVDAQARSFRASHSLNFYQRAKLANTFLWALRDGGCPAEYAQELTEWLTLRL
jgi:hypothetical protein